MSPGASLATRRAAQAAVPLAALGAVVVAVVVGSDPARTPTARATPSPRATVSATDFCAEFVTLATVGEAALNGRSAFVDVKAAARRVRTLAASVDIPAPARAGLDYVLGTFLALPDDTTPDQLAAADDSSSIDDSASADALAAWLASTCPA